MLWPVFVLFVKYIVKAGLVSGRYGVGLVRLGWAECSSGFQYVDARRIVRMRDVQCSPTWHGGRVNVISWIAHYALGGWRSVYVAVNLCRTT